MPTGSEMGATPSTRSACLRRVDPNPTACSGLRSNVPRRARASLASGPCWRSAALDTPLEVRGLRKGGREGAGEAGAPRRLGSMRAASCEGLLFLRITGITAHTPTEYTTQQGESLSLPGLKPTEMKCSWAGYDRKLVRRGWGLGRRAGRRRVACVGQGCMWGVGLGGGRKGFGPGGWGSVDSPLGISIGPLVILDSCVRTHVAYPDA